MNHPPPPQNDPLSTESPLPKKPKINEEKVDSDEEIMLYSDEEKDKSSPRKPFYSKYDCYYGNYDKELWKRYRQQVKDSEGFDIVDYPGQCPMTTVFPMPNYLNNTNNYNTMKDYAGKALKKYNNEKGTSYEVDNILKVNGGVFDLINTVNQHIQNSNIYRHAPTKKQEMSEEIGDESCSDIEALFSDDEYESEDDYDHNIMKKYCQQIKETQGFDVEDYPGQCWMTTAFPMPSYLNNPVNVHKIKDYAGKSLKEYNDREGTSYDVDDILKVNGGGSGDFVYYITFSVKIGVQRTVFQAKVVEDFNYHLEFPIIRPKVEAVVE